MYICSVFSASTLFIAADTWSNIYATLEQPLYPGGPVGWTMEHYNHPIIVLGNVCFLLTSWLSDGFMVSALLMLCKRRGRLSIVAPCAVQMYRCYIVYTQSRGRVWLMLLPGLLYLASLGMSHIPVASCIRSDVALALDSNWLPPALANLSAPLFPLLPN